MPVLDLNNLGAGKNPGITTEIGNSLRQAGAVCLDLQGHKPGVPLTVRSHNNHNYTLAWAPADAQARRAWNDHREATEEGATGVAVLLIKQETDHMVLARSWIGTGFDYLLGNDNTSAISETEQAVTQEWAFFLEDDSLVARGRMEVTGIMQGDDSAVRKRRQEKLEQVTKSDHLDIPAYIVVVEFSRPLAEVTEK